MKALLVLVLLLLPATGWGATYYVDPDCTDTNPASATVDGTEYNPATLSCTGGTEDYYVTIADLNAKTLSAGDFVYFKKGEVWREQLSPLASGTAGNLITYGAYGSGAAPVINGANIITSFTQSPTSEIIEQQTSGATAVITRIAAGMVTSQGFKTTSGSIDVPQIDVNIQKAGSPTGNVWVEIWATTGTPSRPTGGAPVATSASVDVSTLGASFGWTAFTFASPPTLTNDTDYVLILNGDWTLSDTVGAEWALNVADNYRGDDPYSRGRYTIGTPPTVNTVWNHDFTFKIYQTTTGNVYYKTGITTEPHQVFYDGVLLTENDTATSSVGANEWDWAANTLYINVGEDPAGGTVEISQRHGIWGASRDYMVYDGLHITKTNGYGIYADSANNTTIQNSEIDYSADYGIIFGTSSGDDLVYNNNIHHNGSANVTSGSGIFTWEDAGTSGHENYIQGNTISNNYCFGISLNSNYYIIENNTVHSNGNPVSGSGCNGIEIVNLANNGYARYVTVRYNVVYGQVSSQNDATGIAADDYCAYSSFYYNVSYGNDGPGFGAWKANNVSFYNNTSYGNMLDSQTSHAAGLSEFSLGSNAADVSNIVVKNNIALGTSATFGAITCDAQCEGSTGLDITNNIWYASATNWYFWNGTGGNNLTTWNAFTGVGTDLNSDPLFINAAGSNFRLRSASPAINAGVDVSLTEDYLGNTVPFNDALDLPEIGAYEWGYGGPILTTPADSATDVGWPVEFVWEIVEGATMYHLQVDDSGATFPSPEIDVNNLAPGTYCNETECTYSVNSGGALDYSTEYWWRVRALAP